MNKVELLYHAQTDTYWSNDKNWRERWETEVVSFGHIEMNTDNIFEIKQSMNRDGYDLVKDIEGTPFKGGKQ
jgi:hypothetical protein